MHSSFQNNLISLALNLLDRTLPPLVVCLVLFTTQAGAQAATLFEGEPPPTMFTHADRVVVTTERTVISRTVPLRERQKNLFLFPVGEGPLELDVEDVELRWLENGRVGNLEQFDRGDVLRRQVRARVQMESFGLFRRLPTARLVVDNTRPINHAGGQLEIASYRIAVRYTPLAEGTPASRDTAFEAGGFYRRMLDHVMTVPAVVEHFILPDSTSPLPGPTSWQPRPELSPGFPWLLVPITGEGVYTIDGVWMREAGVDPTVCPPEELVLYAEGEPVALEVSGPSGAGLQGGQRVSFYATGTDSAETRERIYYLGRAAGGQAPLRFAAGPTADSAWPEITRFRRTTTVEQDNVFETQFGTFLSVQDMGWYWAEMQHGQAVEAELNLPGLTTTSDDGTSTLTAVLHLNERANVRDRQLEVRIAGETVESRPMTARTTEYAFTVSNARLRQGENSVSIVLQDRSETPESRTGIFFDKLMMEYDSFLTPANGLLELRPGTKSGIAGGPARLRLIGTRPAGVLALDVRNSHRPFALNVEGRQAVSHLATDGNEESHIVLVERARIPRAPLPRRSAWMDLTRPEDYSADILIVYHERYADAVTLLESQIRADGYQTLAVPVAAVYENFSHGNLSSDAIRHFLSHAVHEWQGRRPVAAILVGESTSDGRNISKTDLPNEMPIPLYRPEKGQASRVFSTDTVYAWLTPGDEAPDLVVGRLSPSTPEEAMTWARNAALYRSMTDQPTDWASRVVGVADTGEFRASLIEVMNRSLEGKYRGRLVAADDFPWEDNYYLPAHLITRVEDSKVGPLVTSAIEETFDRGAAVVAFFGHGAPNLWSNQRFWFGGGTPNSDILRLQESGRLAYVTSFTCNNAVVDYPLKPWNVSIAEDFMRHPRKGAVSCFMPSGPGYLTNHIVKADGFLLAMSRFGVREHGLLAEMARLYHQVRHPGDVHARMFLFLGDPTIRLPLPGDPPARALEDERSAPIVIEEAHLLGPEDGLERTWSLVLANTTLRESHEGALRWIVYTSRGQQAAEGEQHISLAGGERVQMELPVSMPGPGGYQVVFEIPSNSGIGRRSRLPSTRWEDFVVVGDGGNSGYRIATTTIHVGEGATAASAPQVRMSLYNPGNSTGKAQIEGYIYKGEEEVGKFNRQITALAPGSVTNIAHPFPSDLELSQPVRLTLTLTREGTDHRWVLDDDIEWYLDMTTLPDLVIDPASVRVFPEILTDGLTVFVDVEVENRGQGPSPPFQVGLYRSLDVTRPETLRDMTSRRPRTIEALMPGEKRPVRLRWDPVDNAGQHVIHVWADASGSVAETDKSNNHVPVELSVRTKMKLVPGNITVRRGGEPGVIELLARVGNAGGTDARRVVVTFYRSEEQNDENRIAEAVVESVPAGEQVTILYPWRPSEPVADLESLTPSFAVALRGSLMRSSSVADAPSGIEP